MKTIKFTNIKDIVLMGGSPLLAALAIDIHRSKKYNVHCFSCERQLNEVINAQGQTLKDILLSCGIKFFAPDDICHDQEFIRLAKQGALALGFGEPWVFDQETIDLFAGRLLDFMGIPLPQYRGGAHYSWLIMNGKKEWACNIQLINKDMVQGVFDSGEIIKSRAYHFSNDARIPQDYFDAAVRQELDFIKEFLNDIEGGVVFNLSKLNEEKSVYFPRLYTLKHGWINWSWQGIDIERFICAFDSPYKGASCLMNNQRVFLKNVFYGTQDGGFHPFITGLVYRHDHRGVCIALKDGNLLVKEVLDEQGKSLLASINPGDRFYTPIEYIEQAINFKAEYGKQGIVSGEKK